jgi:putative membrane protein
MAITHTFLDFIPSIFLGCPDTESELSVLPGHELLLEGKGYEAIMLTAYGGIAAIAVIILLAYPSILFIDKAFDIIKKIIPYLLILASLILIFTEKKKFNALIVFLLTGILGWITTQIQFNQPLLPLLTGLFGSSMLIISIKDKIKIPKQKITKPEVNIKKPILSSFISSLLCGFLPAIGGGQAAILGNLFVKKDRKNFLVLLGSTNIFIMGFSFLAYFAISKTRTGASAAVKELMGNLSKETLILILIVILISGIFSFFLTKIIAKFFSNKITKINYSKISIATLIFLIIIVFLISGWVGLLILILSTFTGIYCISLNVKRVNMMGCLILPTIIFYLFL